MRPFLLPVLSAALLAAPAAAQDAPTIQAPKPKVQGVDVTFLANAGFFLESGRYSILIDAFLREPTDIYAGLPEEVYKKLVNAQPPFDDLTIVLVSHDHADHVQMRGLEKFLAKNPMAQVMASPHVLRSLQAQARDFEAIHKRLTPIPTVKNAMNKIIHEELSIEFLQLEHGGNVDILNLGHLIEIGGVKILHVGDAKPSVENFAVFDLDSRGIDVAIVPYWFFNQQGGMRALSEYIRAKTVVACHVPPSEMEKFDQLLKSQLPDVVLFHAAMEKRHFLPANAGTAAEGD